MDRPEKRGRIVVPSREPERKREGTSSAVAKGVKKVLLFRPTMGEGGADRVTITLLRHLDREAFQPSLVLVKLDGVLLDQVPEDVRVIDLGASRLRFSWLRLASILRCERPDILLSTSSGGNLVAALAHALVPDPNRGLVLSERNTFSAVRRERRSRWLPVVAVTRRLYQRANRIIAVSEGVARDLVESLDLPEDLVTAIHNPVVDEDLYELAEEPVDHPWLEGEQPVLLSVGRLVPQKDYTVLLRAFSRIRKTRPIRLIVLGEGTERRRLERYAQRLGIRDDVDFSGFVKNPFPFMRRCTVYVLSSRFEGLPGALIQAMACGAPVISTDCPSGPSEIVDSGYNGFLVPVGDDERLAARIERLLDNPELRRSFSEAGRRAVAEFEVTPMIRHYEEALLSSIPDAR
jgi:glycosyltransferase involved in cell wall biosynthesis